MGLVSTSPDVNGIRVSVAPLEKGVAGAAVFIGHLKSMDSLIDKSRDVTKYDPLNDRDYDPIVATGRLTQNAISFEVLYDPEAKEGINTMEKAIDDDTDIQITMELKNAKEKSKKGTIVSRNCKISSFKVTGEDNGKYVASVSIETLGKPIITKAEA